MKINSKAIEQFVGYLLSFLATFAGVIVAFDLEKGIPSYWTTVFFLIITLSALCLCVFFFSDRQTDDST
jgi:uncharacterized membrane protein YuzA (DUF378 family)